MRNREVLIYFAWSRPGESGAPLEHIDDRFPGLFELRRLFFPRFEPMADPAAFDQGIGGFLDHVQKRNFTAFAQLAEAETGRPTRQIERVLDDGTVNALDDALIGSADTIIVISFDSFRTGQEATAPEIVAVERFLAEPGNMIFVCPHHDIGSIDGLTGAELSERRVADHFHHGDPAIPPRQGFGGFARSLLAGLGTPVENRFGLRPARTADGAPTPIEAEAARDDLGLLEGVTTFNLHAHLPQLERVGAALDRLEVLARQGIDPDAPPHPFTADGRFTFDALLQSRPDAFAGRLLVSDTTMWSSTAGGVESLERLWSNVLRRAGAAVAA